MAPAALLTLCLLIQSVPSGSAPAAPAAAATPATPTTPVARVGDTSWNRAQYGEWLVDRFGVVSLHDYVCEQVILLEASKRNLLPTEAQNEAEYELRHRHVVDAAYGGDEARWEHDQIRSGFTAASARQHGLDELRADLAVEALIRAGRDLSDAQVAARFTADFGPAGERLSIEVLHFSAYRGLVPGSRPDLAALKQAALERAQAARAAWVAGAKVADLLADADDPGRDVIVRGVVAEFRPMLLGKDIDAAVSALDEPGDISQPIEAFDGPWLVRLVSRETVTPEQVHDQLLAELRDAPIDTGEVQIMRNSLMDRYQPELLLH